ncbi:MAG: hypothetical protein K0S74_410 [Chlamydiales bacterium]|jgi:hypothetical protein|nr:hypothetical protein [Chlamydiales bacterium]
MNLNYSIYNTFQDFSNIYGLTKAPAQRSQTNLTPLPASPFFKSHDKSPNEIYPCFEETTNPKVAFLTATGKKRLQKIMETPVLTTVSYKYPEAHLLPPPLFQLTPNRLLANLYHIISQQFDLTNVQQSILIELAGEASLYVIDEKKKEEDLIAIDLNIDMKDLLLSRGIIQQSQAVRAFTLQALKLCAHEQGVVIGSSHNPYFENYFTDEPDTTQFSIGYQDLRLNIVFSFNPYRRRYIEEASFFITLEPEQYLEQQTTKVHVFAATACKSLTKAYFLAQAGFLAIEKASEIKKEAWERWLFNITFKGQISVVSSSNLATIYSLFLKTLHHTWGQKHTDFIPSQGSTKLRQSLYNYLYSNRRYPSQEDRFIYLFHALWELKPIDISHTPMEFPEKQSIENSLLPTLKDDLVQELLLLKIQSPLLLDLQKLLLQVDITLIRPFIQILLSIFPDKATSIVQHNHNFYNRISFSSHSLSLEPSFLLIPRLDANAIFCFLNDLQRYLGYKEQSLMVMAFEDFYNMRLKNKYWNYSNEELIIPMPYHVLLAIMSTKISFKNHLICVLGLLSKTSRGDERVDALIYATFPLALLYLSEESERQVLLNLFLRKFHISETLSGKLIEFIKQLDTSPWESICNLTRYLFQYTTTIGYSKTFMKYYEQHLIENELTVSLNA